MVNMRPESKTFRNILTGEIDDIYRFQGDDTGMGIEFTSGRWIPLDTFRTEWRMLVPITVGLAWAEYNKNSLFWKGLKIVHMEYGGESGFTLVLAPPVGTMQITTLPEEKLMM